MNWAVLMPIIHHERGPVRKCQYRCFEGVWSPASTAPTAGARRCEGPCRGHSFVSALNIQARAKLTGKSRMGQDQFPAVFSRGTSVADLAFDMAIAFGGVFFCHLPAHSGQ